MKTKLMWGLFISLGLMSCSIFSRLETPAGVPGQPASGTDNPPAGQSTGKGSGVLPNPQVGLDGLNSYHQELSVSFDGTRDGQPYAWSNTYIRDFWKKSAAGFLLVKTSETGQVDSERLTGSLNQAHYSRTGSGKPCQVTWGALATGADEVLEPASLLPPSGPATEAGQELVNGIDASHYKLDGKSNDARMTGEIWLAKDGGYVVRYQLTLQGDDKTFGSGIQGEQKFAYELSRANALGDPMLPDGCPAVMTDFPVMEGARNLRRLPEALDYTIQAGTDALSQFYQDQLKQQGWTLVSEHKSNPQKPVLIFVNADKKLAANILLDGTDGSKVWVSAQLRAWEPASALSPDMQIKATPETNVPTSLAPTVDPGGSGLPGDIPLYPGVANMKTYGQVLSVTSSDPVESVVTFYRKQMPSLGWAETQGVSGGTTVLSWQKGERVVSITITSVDGKTTIMIIQPPQ